MKVGDLVVRKISVTKPLGTLSFAYEQRERLGSGLVLSKQRGGSNPSHPCVTVYYAKTKATYDIAESLMEVISNE